MTHTRHLFALIIPLTLVIGVFGSVLTSQAEATNSLSSPEISSPFMDPNSITSCVSVRTFDPGGNQTIGPTLAIGSKMQVKHMCFKTVKITVSIGGTLSTCSLLANGKTWCRTLPKDPNLVGLKLKLKITNACTGEVIETRKWTITT